jgi:hypothetical protein
MIIRQSFLLALLLTVSRAASAQEFTVGLYGAGQYQFTHTVPASGPAVSEGEVLFDVNEENGFEVDIDRLALSYEYKPWLKISGGRIPTAYGYYNTAYPHGGLMYLTAMDRPTIVAQHDGESILQTASVGVNAHGDLDFGSERQHRFTYDLDVGNGRGQNAGEVQNLTDRNLFKMVNVRLRYAYRGFIVGGNAAVDWIPPRVDQPASLTTLREQIFGVHLVYDEQPVHAIVEGYAIQHVGADQTFTTFAGLAEVGYTFKDWVTPYARVEFAVFPTDTDPFWAATPQQARGSYEAVSLGLKLQVLPVLSVKVEIERNQAVTDTEYSAATQFAFGF